LAGILLKFPSRPTIRPTFGTAFVEISCYGIIRLSPRRTRHRCSVSNGSRNVLAELGHSLGSGSWDDVLDGFGNRIGARLDHAVRPDKEFGARIDGELVEQSLQFGP
jgi:hypothetical protein